MQRTKKRKVLEDQDMSMQENSIVMLLASVKEELDELKQDKKIFFSRVSLLAKNTNGLMRDVRKMTKTNATVRKNLEKMKTDLSILQAKCSIEKQLKESYRETVQDLQSDLEIYDNRIIELQMEIEDYMREKNSLLARLKETDEYKVSILKADSMNLREIRTVIESNEIQKSLQYIQNRVCELAELTGLEKESREEGMCVICRERPSKIAFAPCGHHCSCEVCSTALTSCPYCRETSTGTFRIFTV